MGTLDPGGYRPTPEDRLWLLRAVQAEGEPRRDVAAALVNRFVFLQASGYATEYPSIAEFVQAYAQPVNPRWIEGGDRWDVAWQRASSDQARRKLLEQSAKRISHRNRTDFSQDTIRAVDRALTREPLLPTVTDFARWDVQPRGGVVLVVPGKPGRNALYQASPTWRGYRVRLEPSEGPASGGGLLFGAVLVVAALGVLAKK